jgi:hypothetical protein
VSRSLPALMELYDKHADKRDRFQILAFHDPRAETLRELDEKLEPIRKLHWKGRDLPFPVLLEPSGKTLERWGIRSFPTFVLIDPQGRVVRLATVEMLDRILSGLKEDARRD